MHRRNRDSSTKHGNCCIDVSLWQHTYLIASLITTKDQLGFPRREQKLALKLKQDDGLYFVNNVPVNNVSPLAAGPAARAV